jgi:hypothetical protein
MAGPLFDHLVGEGEQLSIARRNDRGGLHHEDHASFGRARTVHHFFWNDEALTRQKVIPGSDPSIGTAPTTFE